jgi:hypothetical protein
MSNLAKACTLSLLLALPFAASALDRPSLRPPRARTYVRITNTTNFLAQLQKSSIGKLWKDPQFQDFLGHPDADIWQELLFESESQAEDEVFREQLRMLSGEVVIAFDLDKQEPYIIAAMSEEDFERSLDLDNKLKDIAGEPFDVVKTMFQDQEIIQYIKHVGTHRESSSWQTHMNNTLLIGHSKEWVEKCIVQLKKEPVKEPKGNPRLHVNMPLSKLIRKDILKGMKEDVAKGHQPPLYDPEALLDALGLMGIQGFSTTIALQDDRMIVNTNLRVSDISKGIFTLLDVQPASLPDVSFIPESISSIEVGRFNLLRFWQEIPNVLATAMPAVKPQFDMILAMLQQQAGISFEQDLLAHMGTKYISFAEITNDKQNSVIAVELIDSMAFKQGLESALGAAALQPQVTAGLDIQDFLDHTLYTVKTSDPAQAMAFSVTGDYLLYGKPDGLRQVIRTQSSETGDTAFEKTALVQGMRKQVPPQAFGYSAVDWKQSMAAVIRELLKPEAVSLIRQNWAKSGSALPPPDFNKLPPADHIASFFNMSYQYVEATSDGLHQRIILKY